MSLAAHASWRMPELLLCRRRLGPLPRWHLQGLRATGRQRLVSAALTALQATLRTMPAATAELQGSRGCAVASAVLSHVAASAAQQVLGYVPESLRAGLQDAVASVSAHRDSDAADSGAQWLHALFVNQLSWSMNQDELACAAQMAVLSFFRGLTARASMSAHEQSMLAASSMRGHE